MRVAAATILLVLALPFAGGQVAPGRASFLVYHVDDPLAGPDLPPALRGGGALRLPGTTFDGVLRADDSPEDDPSSVPAHLREMGRLLRARDVVGAPASLALEARIDGGRVLVNLTARGDLPDGALLGVTVFEDAVRLDGASGIDVHAFVARLAPAPETVAAGDEASAEWDLPLDPSWDLARVGVVAHLRLPDGEVAQSATWQAGQPSPVVQEARAVLVEHATASWCEPCAPSDRALSILASRFGEGEAASDAASYLRAPTAWTALAALAAVATAYATLRRRSA